ncbi:hypothetical protein [Abiotrophia defectiva]|uniref:hypothetical protein n=1 Tax=Abiotrophia defectiva TaxID=46125 RepID=UPI0028D10449|nr:hypothetical protein [Abiotrophia defectiva]
MSREYDGVKFYSKEDFSFGWELEKAEKIITSFDAVRKVESINEAIELYNIQELMDIGVPLSRWTSKQYEEYVKKAKEFTATIAKFFSLIDDSNFLEHIQKVDLNYVDDYWTLFERFKVYEKVSSEKLKQYFELPNARLDEVLSHKGVVYYYDSLIADILRTSEETCKFLASHFLEKNSIDYFFPKSFKPEEFEVSFQQHIDSDEANLNILKLIFDAQSTKECPISDKIKLSARRKYNSLLEDYFLKEDNKGGTFEFKYKLSFIYQDEPKIVVNEDGGYHLKYDRKWLEDNLDYPTILNNFNYIFEMFDFHCRSTLVSVETKIGALEKLFLPRGIKSYCRGTVFDYMFELSTVQMFAYYEFLLSHGIDLETVFNWFFVEYLRDEYSVSGFSIMASTATNYAEKCRTLSSEMEGILKQFQMYVRDGKVDRDLFEILSEQLNVEKIPSLISNKYAYANSQKIMNEMHLLFSDQAHLSYIEKTKAKYSTLLKLIQEENIMIQDFKGYQKDSIKWLIERGSLIVDDRGILSFNWERVKLLKDLYDNEVVCVNYWGKHKPILMEMKDAGDIRIENTLFSTPEKRYLNYMLNKAEFSDGLNLRNKYAHSTYPQDKKVQKQDYIQLLKVMVLIIWKINEEFRLEREGSNVKF